VFLLFTEQKIERKRGSKRDASPSIIARFFKGKKKQEHSIEEEKNKEQEGLKTASSHQIEVEPVEAVQKVIDEEEKLLESVEKGEESKKVKSKFTFGSQKKGLNKEEKIEDHSSSAESDDGRKSRKTFSFRSETNKSTADEEDSHAEAVTDTKMEEKSSFFTRHWGRIKEGSDSKKQRALSPEKKAKEEVNAEEPKKPAGIFKRGPKKSKISTSSSEDDVTTVSLRPEPDREEDEITPAVEDAQQRASANENKKMKMVHAVYNEYTQFLRTNSKTKKSASVDELQSDRTANEPEERGSNSDDESKSKGVPSTKQKKDFFKLKGKKAVSADVHHEVSHEENKPTEAPVKNSGRNSGLFSFKSKRDSTDGHKSFDKLDNEHDEFDEEFRREAERASKLKIIPKTKKDDSEKRKISEGKNKSSTLDGHNSGSGFFKLGSRKKTSFSMDDVVLPEAPRDSLPEENKHKMKKYNVKKMTASFYSGEITSSDEQPDNKAEKRRARKPKQSNKSSHRQSGHTSDEEPKKDDGNVFTRMFSRRSLTESKDSKKEKRRSKRRSSMESVPIDVLLQQEAEKSALEQEPMRKSGTVDHIYENFPLAQKEQKDGDNKSTDEEADEYFAEYYQSKKEMSNARRSWSFVMAELKEKISFDGDVDGGSEPIYQMQVEDDDGNMRMESIHAVRLQEMKSDPNLADHRSSSSSADELMMIKKSVEKLDRDYQAHVKEHMSAIQAIQKAAEEQPSRAKQITSEDPIELNFEVAPIHQTLQIPSDEQPKSIMEELIVPIKADDKPELPKVPPPPLLPTRSKNLFRSSSSSESLNSVNSDGRITIQEVSTTTTQSDEIKTDRKQEANTLSSSDSLEAESLEPFTISGSFHTPTGSRQSTLSPQDSLDNSSKQDTNNNDDANNKVELRNSSDKTLVWQSSSQVSTESRPLSDCQLKIADTINFEVNQMPLIKRVVPKPSRRLERSSRVGKRPTSSYSSSNDDSASVPTSPDRKMTSDDEREIKKLTSTSSASSSSSKGQSIASSTEDLATEDGNKENVDMRSSSYCDDVFVDEVLQHSFLTKTSFYCTKPHL
jgi:hypothetical protein